MRFAGLLACVTLLTGPFASPAPAQAAKQSLRAPSDSNIVFGNVADAALLMDVYRPQRPNGRGIIFISGSGWGGVAEYKHAYDDIPLKDDYVPSEFRSHDDWGPQVIPEGYYFVMGDHRNNSSDSRHWGQVPKKYIVGKVKVRWWPLQDARIF